MKRIAWNMVPFFLGAAASHEWLLGETSDAMLLLGCFFAFQIAEYLDRPNRRQTMTDKAPETLACPHCGHGHRLDDIDVYQYITSYWGEEHHDFSCSECGGDFVVKEIVTREWEPFKTLKEALA